MKQQIKDIKELNRIELPIKGYAPITLGFGDVFQGTAHKGIDFGVSEGTPVLAAAAGTVLTSGYQQGGYGWYVILIHHDGSGTVYAHLCKQGLAVGTSVVAGAIVGYSGNTGNSTGPHLHFEYRAKASYQSTVVDPQLYFIQSQSLNPIQSNQSKVVPAIVLKDDLKIGAAEIVCDVANVRNKDMRVIGQIRRGEKATLTGDCIEHNGLRFYRALVVRDVWIAANDGETQIMDNVA